MVRTSIIILSHNCLHETTAPCLESIFAAGAEEDFEVIVVDNNSTDETVPWLTELMKREPRLRCILNSRNRGFAGGNNDGIRLAGGEFLILLNSDCQVAGEWISGLTAPLARDFSIGITGPVSNSVGNEQKIFTSGGTPEEILREGLAWKSHSRGSSFETRMLVFFCVAMRKDLVEKVGLLDEDFGLGFFEDDDYCKRTIDAGYRLVCVEDVFVYHKGGGSFENSGFLTRKIMKENRKKLEEKHGGSSDLSHPRDRRLRVIEGCLGDVAGAETGADARYRISNRLRLLDSMMPKNPIKRFLFRRKLEKLKDKVRERGIDI